MEQNDLYQIPAMLPSTLMETVTLGVRQASNQATFLSYTVDSVLRRKIDDQEKLARGLLNVTVIRFRIPQIALDSASPVSPATGTAPTPKPRDRITDGNGVVWTITDGGVESPLLGYYHDCVCQANPG